VTRPVAEIAAALRELAYRLEDLDDGAALPPLAVTVDVQVTEATVPSEAARMALVDRISGALGLEPVLRATQNSSHYTAHGSGVIVYTPAPLITAEAVVAAARAGGAS
jgi:hypothetical protein